MSLLHDAYTALLAGLTYKENGKIKWVDETDNNVWITIIDVDKEEYICEYDNYNKYWYQNDRYHRVDGPAVEGSNDYKAWLQNDKLHRLDGPAIESNFSKEWHQNGLLHRLDGPAIEYADGGKAWYKNGKFHRLDGPAIEWTDGNKRWYINGNGLAEEEFNRIKK